MIRPRPVDLPPPYDPTPAGPPTDLQLDGRAGLRWPAEPVPAVDAAAYPDTFDLAGDLAARWRLPTDRVLVTAGADDALDRACRAYLRPGRTAVLTRPTFAMLPHYAGLCGAAVTHVDWRDDDFPLDAMLDAADDAHLAAIATPNNPTGLVAPADAVIALARQRPSTLVVADLAYVEFADEDPTGRLLAEPNVLVTRTLSKAWGLAGARVGYALGAAPVISALRAAGGPYPSAAASLAQARARLRHGAVELGRRVERVAAERRRLRALLGMAGLDVPRSQANFLLARGRRAGWLADALAGQGIGVRRFGDAEGRISLPGDRRDFRRLWRACRVGLWPQALLLDIDGVVADVRGSYREAIRRTAGSYGHEPTPAQVAAAKRRPDSNDDWQVTQRLLADAGVTATLDDVKARFESLLERERLWTQERLIPARATLERLARRLPLVAVTGRPRRDAARFLEAHRLADLFAAVVVREDAAAKPDPAPVRLALRRVGARRGWMVGDTPDDVTAARRAGAVPLGMVAPGDDADATDRHLVEAGAARVLRDLADLEELLP